MNYEELEEALDALFPEGYAIEDDEHGRLVIFTRLVEDEEGELHTDGELDEDLDPDLEPLDEDDE